MPKKVRFGKPLRAMGNKITINPKEPERRNTSSNYSPREFQIQDTPKRRTFYTTFIRKTEQNSEDKLCMPLKLVNEGINYDKLDGYDYPYH